jgi:hypothetical protein
VSLWHECSVPTSNDAVHVEGVFSRPPEWKNVLNCHAQEVLAQLLLCLPLKFGDAGLHAPFTKLASQSMPAGEAAYKWKLRVKKP